MSERIDVRAFRVRDALNDGMTPGQLRSVRLARPVHGVRIDAEEAEQLDARARLIAALPAIANDRQFFSHTTAARLHGMPLPSRLDGDVIHLSSPSREGRMRRGGTRGHRIRARVVEIDGKRVESVEDTFVHLARMLAEDELIAVGDWIVNHQRREFDISPTDLVGHVRTFRGSAAVRPALRALEQVRVGADSVQETQTRLLLMRAGLPECWLQHRIQLDGFVAHVDGAWPDLKVAWEYEGDQHRTDPAQFGGDIDRYELLARAGWTIIRISKAHMHGNRRRIVARVVRALRDRGMVGLPA